MLRLVAAIRRFPMLVVPGSRYRFVESCKSRTVVKRGPVLACRFAGTRDVCTRTRGVPRRRDENADAETGIGTRAVPGPGLARRERPMWTSTARQRTCKLRELVLNGHCGRGISRTFVNSSMRN